MINIAIEYVMRSFIVGSFVWNFNIWYAQHKETPKYRIIKIINNWGEENIPFYKIQKRFLFYEYHYRTPRFLKYNTYNYFQSLEPARKILNLLNKNIKIESIEVVNK